MPWNDAQKKSPFLERFRKGIWWPATSTEGKPACPSRGQGLEKIEKAPSALHGEPRGFLSSSHIGTVTTLF